MSSLVLAQAGRGGDTSTYEVSRKAGQIVGFCLMLILAIVVVKKLMGSKSK